MSLEETALRWESRLATWWKFLIVFGVLTIVVTTAFVIVTLAEVQRLSETNNRLNERTVQIANRLEDCTTPHGACYEDSQRRTGQAVVTLNEVTQAAVICADQPGVITRPEMESCIKMQLGK
jgi:hypothetical protein